MRAETEDDIQTALRQAGVIAALHGHCSTRRTLDLALQLYNSMASLDSSDRARRIGLIDAIFGWPERRR